MHPACPVCQLSFEPEPGFYFGAMFVSYAINTLQFFFAWGLLVYFYPSYTLVHLLTLLFGVVMLSLPFTFRLSRAIWLVLFVRYDPTWEKKQND